MAAVLKAQEECKAAHVVEQEARKQAIKDNDFEDPVVRLLGPLISNTLHTAFQFQMSVWRMIGKECIRPLRMKHSDWCGLAGIVQAIVETFPKNCALMFPPPPPPVASFSSTFRPQSSDDDDDNDNYGANN